jgi:hypothetical protein
MYLYLYCILMLKHTLSRLLSTQVQRLLDIVLSVDIYHYIKGKDSAGTLILILMLFSCDEIPERYICVYSIYSIV